VQEARLAPPAVVGAAAAGAHEYAVEMRGFSLDVLSAIGGNRSDFQRQYRRAAGGDNHHVRAVLLASLRERDAHRRCEPNAAFLVGRLVMRVEARQRLATDAAETRIVVQDARPACCRWSPASANLPAQGGAGREQGQ